MKVNYFSPTFCTKIVQDNKLLFLMYFYSRINYLQIFIKNWYNPLVLPVQVVITCQRKSTIWKKDFKTSFRIFSASVILFNVWNLASSHFWGIISSKSYFYFFWQKTFLFITILVSISDVYLDLFDMKWSIPY